MAASFGLPKVCSTPLVRSACRTRPLAESGIVGFAIGMALYGLRPVCEIQFSGLSYLAMHQFESHAARLRWRSRSRYTVPLVARMPYGGGVRALKRHSESREAYYAHTPGLKTVIPSGPRTARALLVSAMRDPDPVIFFEPKLIYRAFREEVPEEENAAHWQVAACGCRLFIAAKILDFPTCCDHAEAHTLSVPDTPS